MDTPFSTTSGAVRGFRAADDVVAVLGVPYAAPPFGSLRFREPAPAEAWTGVRAPRRADGAVRAWHCADVPFAFGNIGDDALAFLIGGAPSAADHALAARMVRAWADFAATGDPGWPAGGDASGAVRMWRTEDQPDGGGLGGDGLGGDGLGGERLGGDGLGRRRLRSLWATAAFPLLRA